MTDFDIKDFVDQEDNEQLRSVPAQRLLEKLSLLKNRVDEAKKRWFWELLQNASDYNETVNVKLTVSDSEVTFSHDGTPFSVRDVLNVISPDSNKADDEVHKDNIGKFGTGLVSTHILSSVMKVSGFCDKDGMYYKFLVLLDRSCYKEKKVLIEQITEAKACFRESLVLQSLTANFNTSFTYALGISLPDLPVLNASDIDLEYLYDTLPYTLCFMPKVQTIVIEDNRTKKGVERFEISKGNVKDGQIIDFVITKDGQTQTWQFAYFVVDDVATVFRFDDKEILPFPKGMSRIFCGLPLVGTEEIGMPFLLNSLKFKPTQEREGVELDPATNTLNRKLFESSVVLYGKMLDFVEKNKMRNAFYLARLRNKYNGTQISNQQFYNLYLAGYKRHILSHSIVFNEEERFVSFSSIILPFKESGPDMDLYENCELLKKSSLPKKDDYQEWFDITDFTIFKEQKYTYEKFAKEIEVKENIYSFGKSPDEIILWLHKCASYFCVCDRYMFSRYRLLPNQNGNLCMTNNGLYADVSLPDELKEIHDALYGVRNVKIGDKLLNRSFNDLNILNQEYTLEMLAKDIDNELSAQYSQNQGNAYAISSSLNRLYNWICSTDIPKERLTAYFIWYYPKRATLIVDMLSENQREQALIIAQSGKMDSLATLASSDLTDEELRFIVANISKLPAVLNMLAGTVDDKTFADSSEGDLGEEIVYRDLISRYKNADGYRVCWASKERNEPCYDFEITKNGQPYCYCDAKTTRRGIANADSIPFFMRKSQWCFLSNLDDSIPYFVARVFVEDGNKIKYLRISFND